MNRDLRGILFKSTPTRTVQYLYSLLYVCTLYVVRTVLYLFGIWYLVFGIWYLVFGILVLGIWYATVPRTYSTWILDFDLVFLFFVFFLDRFFFDRISTVPFCNILNSKALKTPEVQ
jgi:hypothetical protein